MIPRAYYNENDPKAAQWLRELIKAGMIPAGDVDERSIVDVLPSDLASYTQCHFFAGIGGWAWALRESHWPDSRPVWTGSCPCQPFSDAGQSRGFADERHLWPAWFRLIRKCRPYVIFGEQVASQDGLKWFDLVSSDLEGAGYACGALDLCAAGAGAPHIRQRLYFVADDDNDRLQVLGTPRLHDRGQRGDDAHRCGAYGVAQGDAHDARSQRRCECGDGGDERPARPAGMERGMEHAACDGREQRGTQSSGGSAAVRCGDGFWSAAQWLPCSDGKARPVEPGTFPLAHGVPGRVGLLRGYGNAIVPQVAQIFIEAYLDINP